MRSIALALFVTLTAAEGRPDVSGEWVGPLEFTDHRGRAILPTRVTLKVEGDTISGDWIGLTNARSSGLISGGWDNEGRLKLRVTLASGAEHNGIKIAAERCSGDTTFAAELVTDGKVLRMISPKVLLDTVQARARNKHCENLTRLVWTLQRRE